MMNETQYAAANMKARSDLAAAICTAIETWKMTQVEAAKRLEITQPRLNDLLRGRLERFSLDALVRLAPQAGLSVRIEANSLATGSPTLGAPSLSINPEKSGTNADRTKHE